MDNKTVQVVDENEHLGQIVSGLYQEEKNIDLKMESGRKILRSSQTILLILSSRRFSPVSIPQIYFTIIVH